ncbi:2-dehydro-3-deoxygalactonokinase [Tianweitania sp. BSSL-BM11]|uniref:2-dehydro-3-deoxygalactonokinase n=1 Tax=Tianweitania aestuarii TaxID=2814886 RepID=A0ABS5RZD8_9HYPH|nr:2-dehydro-3-deoxygalactonokinase [Tianweitania aestuarii]MBS9722150.1 2-dehydro-3-deoxygalactonokinase [Tianweitania aestuarii]
MPETASSAERVDWIAVDWGTSNLRAWAMADDRAVATVSAPTGMGGLERHQFEPALLAATEPWLSAERPIDVVACGMVGARQGWQEVPYLAVPTQPVVASAMQQVSTSDPRLTVRIVHGLSQMDPADVMRGEETQIAGLLGLEQGFTGMVCLPGTHSKWARVEAGEVQSFRTFMTGELFALLAKQSVLRHSMGEDGTLHDTVFDNAVRVAAETPADLTALLFGIRASGLVADADNEDARSRLSGLLIGAELAAMQQEWSGGDVVLIGADQLAERYLRALHALGGTARMVDAQACTLAGLVAARHQLLEAR